jgi:cytochrome b subunit of formate dehydrogenase
MFMRNKFLNAAKAFAFCVHLATLILCGWALWRVGLSNPQPIGTLEYKDLIAIILTALGVMIAILAALFAVLAIWGFNQIRDQAVAAASKAARKTAEPIAKAEANDVATRVTSLGVV